MSPTVPETQQHRVWELQSDTARCPGQQAQFQLQPWASMLVFGTSIHTLWMNRLWLALIAVAMSSADSLCLPCPPLLQLHQLAG